MSSSSAEFFVDKILTTHDFTKSYEERMEIIRGLAEEIDKNIQKDAVRVLFERYLRSEYTVNESLNEIYSKVYNDAYNECDGRYVDLDFGDCGDPLPAFGPQANVWLTLTQKIWTEEQAVNFALQFIMDETSLDTDVTVERVIIEICSIYPNERRISEALINRATTPLPSNRHRDFQERLSSTIRMFHFYFYGCEAIVPFLKKQLDENENPYIREDAFRALCRCLSIVPNEWNYIFNKFKDAIGIRKPGNIPGKFYIEGRLYNRNNLELLLANSTQSYQSRDLILYVLRDEEFKEKSDIDFLVRKHEEKFTDEDKYIITRQWSK